MSYADQDCASYGAVGLCEHSPCSHKFMGTNTCAKCGTTSESLRAAGYGEAMRLLADAATALQRADEQVSDLRAKLGTQHAELEEVANNLHLQRHYALSLSARYQSQGMRLSEATALLARVDSETEVQTNQLERDIAAFLSRAPAQAEPTLANAVPGKLTNNAGVRAAAAETEVRELRAQLEAVRNAPRWEPCVVDAEDEDGPVYQGFLTDAAGTWVRWEDVSALLSPQAPGTEER